MADYQAFKDRWAGRRINADGVYGFQCVDLGIQYAREELHTTASMYGNAIDFWTNTPQGLLDTCDKIPTTDCQPGDIVILRTVGRTDYAGDGHVGICDHQDELNVWLLEQNANGSATGTGIDAIGVHRSIPKGRIAGIFRPKAPVPVPEAPLWTTEAITPRQVKVNPGSRKWNLAHHDFTSVRDNPITEADGDTHFTAVAVLHHRNIPQYNYYLEDANTPHGWNVLDCGDYTAPLPPPPPYVPPAEPLKGKPAETYVLDWEVPSFPTPLDAMSHKNANGKLTPKTYTVYEKSDLAYNLTEDNMKPGVWINTKDNVPPLPPEPKPLPPQVTVAIQNAATASAAISQPVPKPATPDWTHTRALLHTDGSPDYFYSINAVPVDIQDYSDKQDSPDTMPAFTKHIPIVATYEKDKQKWALPKYAYDTGRIYLIPMRLLKLERPGVVETVEEYINTLLASDHYNQAKYRVKHFIDGIKSRKVN